MVVKKKARNDVKFVLRLPPSLHRKIKSAAKKSEPPMSMNRMIEGMLSDGFAEDTINQKLDRLLKKAKA